MVSTLFPLLSLRQTQVFIFSKMDLLGIWDLFFHPVIFCLVEFILFKSYHWIHLPKLHPASCCCPFDRCMHLQSRLSLVDTPPWPLGNLLLRYHHVLTDALR